MADLPFELQPPLAARLAAVVDVEAKIPRALEALGPLVGRDVALIDVPDGIHVARLATLGVRPRQIHPGEPFHLDAPDASLDALVSLWSAFRGPEPAALLEADRVLRPGGRLLVVHDYGRDEVSALRSADLPEYTSWSRRDGPFLRDAGFRIRVLHCFWTFPSLEDASGFLQAAFGDAGAELARHLKRPRLTWNVAVYHRSRVRGAPPEPPEGGTA
jgi:SAM-dependent methyltransferase